MKKFFILILLFSSVTLFSRHYSRQGGVKLGFSAGWSYSDMGKNNTIKDHHNIIWGFHVDIPIISTFNIVPSAMLYKIDYGSSDLSAADISLSAKFKVPLNRLTLYGLATGGLTQAQFRSDDGFSFHIGLGAGVSFVFVSNLSFFLEGNYRLIISDYGNVDNFFVTVGILWGF